MPNTSGPLRPAPRQVFRQRSALVAGGFLLVVLAIILVLTLLDDLGDAWLTGLWCVAIGLIVWVGLIRPSVELSADGVVLRNLVRDVHLPWPHVDVLESRWNLKVFTPEDVAYSAWAISAQRPKPERRVGTSRGGLGRGQAPAASGGRAHPSGSAADVAGRVRAAREDYDLAVLDGRVQPQTGFVVRRWARAPIVALAAAAVCIVVALIAA